MRDTIVTFTLILQYIPCKHHKIHFAYEKYFVTKHLIV